MKRPGAIVQARMSSRRLPGKVLADLAGKPMLVRIVERLRRARSLAFVGVATSVEPSDDPIAACCEALGIPCFRGPLDDVLARYVAACEHRGLDAVVRITGDCPFVCPEASDHLVERRCAERADSACFDRPTLHAGIDPFSVAMLARFHREGASAEEREHLALLVEHHLARLHIAVAPTPAGHEDLGVKLSVDRAEELDLARRIYAWLGARADGFGTAELVAALGALGLARPPGPGVSPSAP